MYTQLDTYRNMLSPEIRLMCDLISPGYSLDKTHIHRQLQKTNPEQLLNALKVHRLYPHFYKVWVNSDFATNEPIWVDFNKNLKQLVEANKMQMLQKTSTLIHITKNIEKQGIPIIALKGPALALQLYGDVGMRYSSDLDFLVLPEHLEPINEILLSLGFTNYYPNYPFTSRQKKFYINNYNHIIYTHPKVKGNIEIHWQLPQLSPYISDSTAYFDNIETIDLAEHSIHVLSSNIEPYYLAAHGAAHSFYRLAWLYDVGLLYNAKNWDMHNAYGSKNKELTKLVNTVHTLHEAIFNISLDKAEPINNLFIKHCIKTIGQIKDKAYKPWIIREYIGKILLCPRRKLNILSLKPLLTSPRDWNTISLPDFLFFLYFILRPFLFLYRKIKKL